MSEPILIVTGLPRSGTSLMMQLLEAAGVPLLVDNVRKADEHNPHGYYEYEPVKRLEEDASWIEQARGKALKVVSPLLRHLPDSEQYRVLYMDRPIEQILASQGVMLGGNPGGSTANCPRPDQLMMIRFRRHLLQTKQWLVETPHFDPLFVNAPALFAGERDEIARCAQWINCPDRTADMQRMIDTDLWHHR